MTLGEKIKARREEVGISQADLASTIGVNSSMVLSNWEKDKSKPDTEKMLLICQALSCPLKYFYPISNEEYTEQEINIIQKFRLIDEIGQDVVISALENQVSRCKKSGIENVDEEGSVRLTAAPVNEPIFLTKNNEHYDEMKEKMKALKKKKKSTYLDASAICTFLHYMGYNFKINIVDIIMIFNGVKIPSQKLYDDIDKILQLSLDLYKK